MPDIEPLSRQHDREEFDCGVRAMNDNAAGFYPKHGFVTLPTSPRRLFLPLRTLLQIGEST